MKTMMILEEDTTQFATLTDDDAKFEYAQYVINTPPEDRPEISEDDAKAALDWMESQS